MKNPFTPFIRERPQAPPRLSPINLALQHRLARKLHFAQRADYSYYVDIVGTCNLRCPSCAVGNMVSSQSHGFMSAGLYEQILEKIEAENTDGGKIFIDLYNWGEPGLHPELPRIIEATKSHGFGVGISSNLNVFRNMREVIKAEPNYIRVSLSGFYQEVYGRTHAKGSVYALKSNLFKLREMMDRYHPETIVQLGFHVYRSNFPRDFLAVREVCDELGFLFAPVLATLMPAEQVVTIATGQKTTVPQDLLDNLVLSVEESLAQFRQQGGPTPDCQYRQSRTTIAHDGSVDLCCAIYGNDKQIAKNFLNHDEEELRARKYAHPFCGTCMSNHVNKLYIGIGTRERNERAVEILGPLFEAYLEENAIVNDPDHVVFEDALVTKDEIYQRAMSAIGRGPEGLEEAQACLSALMDQAPDFGEGYFQAGRLAISQGDKEKAEDLLARAVALAPDNPNYAAALAGVTQRHHVMNKCAYDDR